MSSDFIRIVHRTPGVGATIDVLGRLWRRLAGGSRRRYAVQFRNLSDAALRDVGLSRSVISSTAFGPIHPPRINHHI
jgi:uncharacterized protein YjiS (DUF1127 family)